MSTGGRRTGMFFRMRRLLAPVGAGKSPEFSHCEQPACPMHHGIAERAEAKRQDPIIAWFLVQPMNIATGRLGDHFAVLIRGAIASDFRKGEKSREEITDLMAGGETMATLEAEIDGYSSAQSGNSPIPA